MRNRWPLVVIIVTAVAVPSLGASPTTETDAATAVSSAVFTYTGGGTVDGTLKGGMEAYHVRFDSMHPEPLSIKAAKASVYVIQMTFNTTYAAGRAIFTEEMVPHQAARWVNLSGESLGLAWPHDEALANLYGPGFPLAKAGLMRIEVEAEAASWAPTEQVAYRDPVLYPAKPFPVAYGGFGSWHRPLKLEAPAGVTVGAPFVFHLRGSLLFSSIGEAVDLGPFRQLIEEVRDPTGALVRQQVRYSEALLFVEEGEMAVTASETEFAVAGLDLDVKGDLTLNAATGRFQVGPRAGDFNRESFGLDGSFRLVEEVPAESRRSGGGSDVSGQAAGRFDVVAVDYIVTVAPVDGVSLAERVLWITLALAVLAFLAKLLQHLGVALYSRIQEDAVLENPRRAEIMRFVDANPGCNVTRVAGELAMARGVTRHHLMVLERAGKIRRRAQEGQVSVYPARLPPSTFQKAIAAGDARLRHVVSLLDTGAVPRAHLVERLRSDLGVSDPAARRCIAKAERLGLIEASGSGRSVAYRAAS